MKEKNIEQNVNTEQLLQQWQTCVDLANSVSQRRDSINNLFVSINLAVSAAISIIWDIKTIILSIAGVVACVFWMVLIFNFRRLNKAKFKVIEEIEKEFQYAPLTKEYQFLKADKKYKDSTFLELVLPLAFISLYFILFVVICVITLK